MTRHLCIALFAAIAAYQAVQLVLSEVAWWRMGVAAGCLMVAEALWLGENDS